MKILAVDYGDARTGLAECDPGEVLCSPVLPQITETSMKKVAEKVAAAAQEMGCGQIVLGLPKNMDGSEGDRAQKSRLLAGRIREACDIPVVLWDERRTTVSAAAILSQNDVYGRRRKQRLDSVSAAVLLEGYLAWRRQHPGETPE